MSTTPKFTNRLQFEKSPYLLQHAHNPVQWFAWGEEAFEKARTEQKPIFLSIGYSTCHWCHVMEHESFESQAIAELLNQNFVSVKVDREERPDLDKIYMTFVQASTGSGGWPMSVWLTPDLKPFLGGTYFPPEDRYGRPGFASVLQRITDTWKNEPNKILDAAEGTARQLKSLTQFHARDDEINLDRSALDNGFQELAANFDHEYGGFGQAPKFPRPVQLEFMLYYAEQHKNNQALNMALTTLRKMAEGGIHDLVSQPGKGGGGFARYATDRAWHVPHFEKMLYDNAQLITLYLEAFQCSKDDFYSNVALDILNYVNFDMRSPEGGYYSAEDADSFPTQDSTEKKEGGFYIWHADEIKSLLSDEEYQIISMIYDIQQNGNVKADPHAEFRGYNILQRIMSNQKAAQALNTDSDTVQKALDKAIAKLYDARLKRPRPHLDDKIITSWNALMISALAKASVILHNPDYLTQAEQTTGFIFKHLYNDSNQELYRRYRDGESAIDGKVDDYAFLVHALIDLYEASLKPEYLLKAITLAEKQVDLFYDTENGGFYSASGNDPNILMRLKEDHDGAEPSANSISAINFLKLSQMTDREDFYDIAKSTIFSFNKVLAKFGTHMPLMLVALGMLSGKLNQVILSGSLEHTDMQALRSVLFSYYKPGKIVLHASEETGKLMPFLKELPTKDAEPTVFMCIDFACQLPIKDPGKLHELLNG
jgi:hypothetical protein